MHRIPAKDLLWFFVLGAILRQSAYLAIEALVGSTARRNLAVSRAFGDDALGYFTERLDPGPGRAALASVLRQAKRNKAFDRCSFVSLALTIERLYRLRYLHRGTHAARTALEFVHALWLSFSRPLDADSS